LSGPLVATANHIDISVATSSGHLARLGRRAALLDIFKTLYRAHFLQNARQ
jgi:hypothetical protein